MWFATTWEYCKLQWFQNMTKEVLSIVTVLLGHQINDVESIDSPNNSQHEILGPDLLLHLLRDIILGHLLFRRMMKFQSKLTLVHSHKSSKFLFPVTFQNGQ
jgi:hypothetical protein